MAATTPSSCRDCGASVARRADLNRRGRCPQCALAAAVEAAAGMALKAGPYYERWAASNYGRPRKAR